MPSVWSIEVVGCGLLDSYCPASDEMDVFVVACRSCYYESWSGDSPWYFDDWDVGAGVAFATSACDGVIMPVFEDVEPSWFGDEAAVAGSLRVPDETVDASPHDYVAEHVVIGYVAFLMSARWRSKCF